jgi:hypothetical protein
MKRIAIATVAFAMMAGLLTPPVEAKGRINNRQCKQHGRIYQGVSNGALTRNEAYRLGTQQQRLAQREQRMRASGNGLTASERFRLEQQQDNLSQNIYSQKHDAQTR